ncbi:MAG: hypothetical protein A3D44_01955 [Candidatus Staskawiczbacteria bacterium RIFCSPHIGHO2_02_FULL_42_22]|uniref:Uncharacterized protein n=1 Tax=Candidatus Staskawiczbacteria bacterium RIFCSPHIGHO2_02_FULL_42_22 TaxID=1802207 RepID=A0A1G2I2T3_9BACT|nr:MAG: hypothetical protein A3D44_01955 [Candidatus Staskawiczbacteria bacterium RIFCSPHIGHO2_02_FULL_42_22]
MKNEIDPSSNRDYSEEKEDGEAQQREFLVTYGPDNETRIVSASSAEKAEKIVYDEVAGNYKDGIGEWPEGGLKVKAELILSKEEKAAADKKFLEERVAKRKLGGKNPNML